MIPSFDEHGSSCGGRIWNPERYGRAWERNEEVEQCCWRKKWWEWKGKPPWLRTQETDNWHCEVVSQFVNGSKFRGMVSMPPRYPEFVATINEGWRRQGNSLKEIAAAYLFRGYVLGSDFEIIIVKSFFICQNDFYINVGWNEVKLIFENSKITSIWFWSNGLIVGFCWVVDWSSIPKWYLFNFYVIVSYLWFIFF